MKREKEFTKSFNKPSESIKYFEKLMRSPRSNNDTCRLGYTGTEEGEKKVRIPNLLVIIMVRKDILLTCAGARL